LSDSFVDTTILVAVADPHDGKNANAEAALAARAQNDLPNYALRELQAGVLRYLCDVHNVILSSANFAEALVGLTQASAFQGRQKAAKIQIAADTLNEVFAGNPHGARSDITDEAVEALALRIAQLWLVARSHKRLTNTQPLTCFNDGDLHRGTAGELRGPRGSFNCLGEERCAAAAYMYEDKAVLQKLHEALHPDRLSPEAAEKQENKSRRAALKELLQKGPAAFSKKRCRALGDAYFAAMAPAGKDILTTNTVDFLPLCNAVGKKVVGL
jgi:hypothetical protein